MVVFVICLVFSFVITKPHSIVLKFIIFFQTGNESLDKTAISIRNRIHKVMSLIVMIISNDKKTLSCLSVMILYHLLIFVIINNFISLPSWLSLLAFLLLCI